LLVVNQSALSREPQYREFPDERVETVLGRKLRHGETDEHCGNGIVAQHGERGVPADDAGLNPVRVVARVDLSGWSQAFVKAAQSLSAFISMLRCGVQARHARG
jgi:hypothetical protein